MCSKYKNKNKFKEIILKSTLIGNNIDAWV
jgi:hypothetical protein